MSRPAPFLVSALLLVGLSCRPPCNAINCPLPGVCEQDVCYLSGTGFGGGGFSLNGGGSATGGGSGGGNANCIPDLSTRECNTSADCCGTNSRCRYFSSTSNYRCVACKSNYDYCDFDEECCSGGQGCVSVSQTSSNYWCQ